jgi:hypothetical protein
MSQAGSLDPSGSNPSIPTSFETQDGTAVPVGNIIIFEGDSTNVDDDNGIRVIKGAAANEVLVQLTNTNFAQVTTTDATPTTIATISLGGDEGTYIVRDGFISCYNVTDQLSAAYSFEGCARTDGSSGFLIGNSTNPENVYEDTGMEDCEINISISGNDLIVQVTGLASKTINWEMNFKYSFVGATI